MKVTGITLAAISTLLLLKGLCAIAHDSAGAESLLAQASRKKQISCFVARVDIPQNARIADNQIARMTEIEFTKRRGIIPIDAIPAKRYAIGKTARYGMPRGQVVTVRDLDRPDPGLVRWVNNLASRSPGPYKAVLFAAKNIPKGAAFSADSARLARVPASRVGASVISFPAVLVKPRIRYASCNIWTGVILDQRDLAPLFSGRH